AGAILFADGCGTQATERRTGELGSAGRGGQFSAAASVVREHENAMLSEWWSRVRYFVAGKKRAEVDEEIQFHLEREVEANVAAGMPAAEAQRGAAIAFGGRG